MSESESEIESEAESDAGGDIEGDDVEGEEGDNEGGEGNAEGDIVEEDEDEDEPHESQIGQIIIVAPENRKTSNLLSLMEMTSLISIRASQIAKFANCFCPEVTNESNPILQAKYELMNGKCPLTLRRKVGEKNGQEFVEDWNPNEMIFATYYDLSGANVTK
jgi:hypothetical protein